MEIKELHNRFLSCSKVVIDSREIHGGELFVALKGTQQDGNAYCNTALLNGAKLIIIDNPKYYFDDPRIVLVEDSLKALQQLANYHRSTFKFPVLGITGSNGKTTTKELIYHVLSKKFTAFATKGNYNNHIGVPLTILSTPADCNFLIVEMGANHIGDIAELCNIADPDFGLITNIGKAHIEGFGSLDGVRIGKTELYRHLIKKSGVIFYNEEDQVLRNEVKSYGQKVAYSPDALFTIVDTYPFLRLSSPGGMLNTKLYGEYNLPNIGAAYCIGKYFGIDDMSILEGIASYTPENNRSQFIQRGNSYFILDAYNANPSSMISSIDSFSKIMHNEKIIILGDMLELGDIEDAGHREVLNKLNDSGINNVILVGPIFYKYDGKFPYQFFKSRDEASEFIKSIDLKNKLILLKASRGIALETLLNDLP